MMVNDVDGGHKNINGDSNSQNIQSIRSEFPFLEIDPSLVYLDSGATSQKPRSVIDAMSEHMRKGVSSPHRGAHKLSVDATEAYETSKKVVGDFVDADPEQIIYTRGTTESINLISSSITKSMVGDKKKVVLFITNHHSNILPWQRLCKEYGLTLQYVYLNKDMEIDETEFLKIDKDTFLVAFPMIANGIGLLHDYRKIIKISKEAGALTLIDCAQSVGKIPVSFKELDVDVLVFSGHKMFAPTGIGVLVAKKDIFEALEPYHLGGDMIEYVYEDHATYAPIPQRFEAGTQNLSGAIGLAEAVKFIQSIGINNILEYEEYLTKYMVDRLTALDFVDVIGGSHMNRATIVSFNIKDIHSHDTASILDDMGIAIRAGHHCCQPLMASIGQNSCCRASLSVHNTKDDIDRLVEGLYKVTEVFGYDK